MLRSCILILALALSVIARAQLAISEPERQALIAFYRSTGGDHWKNHDKWLEESGKECEWHGVLCDQVIDSGNIGYTVRRIELGDNDLTGSLPEEVCSLTGLRNFDLSNNAIGGKIPECLYKRPGGSWVAIAAHGTRLEAVQKVSLERFQGGLLCTRRRLTLNDDGLAILEKERCRDPQADRRPYCETRYGHFNPFDFSQLVSTVEAKGFFALDSEYRINATHQESISLVVSKNGSSRSVTDYGHAAPLEMQELEMAVSGLERLDDWDEGWDVTETGPCRWSAEPKPPEWISSVREDRTGTGPYSNREFGFRFSAPGVISWSDYGYPSAISHGAFVHLAEVKHPAWADRNMTFRAEFPSLQTSAGGGCAGPYSETFVDPDDKSKEIRRATSIKRIAVSGLTAESCHTVFESSAWGDKVIEDEIVVTRSNPKILDPSEREVTAIRYRFSLNTVGATYSADRLLFDRAVKTLRYTQPELWRSR